MADTSGVLGNRLLAAMSASDLEILLPHLEHVELQRRQPLAEPNEPVEHVYFPTSGIASIVLGVRRDPRIEIGIAGRDGLANLCVICGDDRSPTQVFIQVAGGGLRIAAAALDDALRQSASLDALLTRYVHVFFSQAASTALANGRGNLEERLARWLLMADDRLDDGVLPLTHEFLSVMLGVRRSGVTVALREFEAKALVHRRRGSIVMLDRPGMTQIANGYYGIPEREMDRLFPAAGS